MAEKTYYMSSGDMFNRVQNIPPEKKTLKDGGGVQTIPAGSVLFVNGVYRTSDPDEQAALDAKDNLSSFEAWQAAYPQGEKQAHGA